MNVLTIIDTLSVGGLGNVALSAAKALVDSGHSSFVLILYNDVDVVIPNGVNIIPMKLERKKSISKYHLQVKSLIDSIKFDNLKGVDLILVHGMHAIKILKECNYENAYFYIHNTLSIDMTKNYSFLKGLMKKIKIKNLYSGLNLIAVSEGVKNDALENIKIKPKSIRVIYNIIDIDTLRKKSLDVNPYQEDRYIVNISRFVPEKRHDLLIEAYMRSRIDCKLILIGDGIMRKKIEGLVQSNNLSGRVVLVGGVTNPMPILKDAKCLVHTSDFEGFGLVLVEALALNIPVIARDCPSGPSEILTGKLRENLIPLNNYQLLSQRMSEICNQNADLDFGLYIQKFLAQNIIKQYEKLEYSHVC